MVRIRKILLVVVSALVGIFFILPLIGVGILKWAVLPPGSEVDEWAFDLTSG